MPNIWIKWEIEPYLAIKVSATTEIKDHKNYVEVKKVFKHAVPDLLVCHQEGERVLAQKIPVSLLTTTLLTGATVF